MFFSYFVYSIGGNSLDTSVFRFFSEKDSLWFRE